MIFKEICQSCCFCCFIYKLLFLLNKFIHHIIKKKKKHNVSPEIYYIAPFFYRGLRIFVTPKESKKASVYAYQSMYWSRRLICLLYNYLLTTHSGIANKSWSMSPRGGGWLYSSVHNAWGCWLWGRAASKWRGSGRIGVVSGTSDWSGLIGWNTWSRSLSPACDTEGLGGFSALRAPHGRYCDWWYGSLLISHGNDLRSIIGVVLFHYCWGFCDL